MSTDPQTEASGNETGFLLRAFWMILGDATLVIIGLAIWLADSAPVSIASLGFLLLAGAIVYARYVDVTRYAGTTSEGDRPANLEDVKRFGTWQFAICGAAWGLVHAI